MAKHCVNIGSDQFKILADQSDLDTLDLAATISLWQDENNSEEFPTLDELNKFNDKYANPEIKEDILFQLSKPKPDDTQALDNAYRDRIYKKFNIKASPKVNEVDLSKLQSEVESKMNNFLSKVGFDVKNVKTISDGKGNVIDAIAKADILKKTIEVIEGKKDIDTLPEESAHVFVALSRGTPEYNAMMDKITEFKKYQEVVDAYSEAYQGNEIKLREEAIGQVISDIIIKKVENERPGLINFIKRVWNKLWNNLSKSLGLIKSQDIAAFSNAANAILNPTKEVLSKLDTSIHLQEDYFYELSPKQQSKVDKIKEWFNPDNIRLKALEVGYENLSTGQKIKHRVSDFVKVFYQRRLENSGKEITEEIRMKALSGTYMHGLREKIMKDLVSGISKKDMIAKDMVNNNVPYMSALIRNVRSKLSSESSEFKELLDSRKAKGLGTFNLTEGQIYELIYDTDKIYQHIMDTNTKINKINSIEGNPPPMILPESMIYLEHEDLAGTLDLLVIYNNGAASIYDYKSSDFGSRPSSPGQLKIEGWDVQLSQYKRILEQQYKITDFVETRIIPMDVAFDIDPVTKEYDISSYKKVLSGESTYKGEDGPTREYLQQVPVANELTDNANLNASLKKLFNERENLRIQSDSSRSNLQLEAKLEKIDFAIKQIQLKKDVNYVINEIQELINTFTDRSQKYTKDQQGYLTLGDLHDMLEYSKIFDGFSESAKDEITEEMIPDEEERNAKIRQLDKITADLKSLNKKINDRINSALYQEIGFDISEPHLQQDMFGRLFTNLGDWESPAFQSLYQLVLKSSDATRLKVNALIEDINEKKVNLEKWADNNNMSLLEAYSKIVNPKTKQLVSQLDAKFYEDRKKALLDPNSETSKTWIKRNLKFDQEGFDKARQNKHDAIDAKFTGEHNKEANLKLKNAWESRFNKEAVHSGNFYYKATKDNSKYYSPEWNYLVKNQPLKEYYETLIKYNQEFSEITGADITDNFIPNIRQDTIDRIAETGIIGLGHLLRNFKHSIEVRDFDIGTRSRDANTGEMVPTIPLFHVQNLREKLSPKEFKKIKDEVIAVGNIVGTLDYELAMEKAVKSAEYKKGNDYKSMDLTRNLILFAESAYSNAHLQETENAARGLKKMLESNLMNTKLKDEKGGTLINKLKGVVVERLGVEAKDVEDFTKYMNMYYYGLHTQNKDWHLDKAIDNISSLNPFKDTSMEEDVNRFSTKTSYSRDKILRKLMQFTSLNNLALDPILGLSNTLGIWSNMLIMSHGGRYFNKAQVHKANMIVGQQSPKFRAIKGFFEVNSRSLTKEKADENSAKFLTKHVTMDNMFAQYKIGDDLADDSILISMMQNYGIDSDGTIKKMSQMESKEAKNLWDNSSVESGKLVINGLNEANDAERIRFRAMVQKVSSMIKGSIPEESKMLMTTNILGQLLMQHRGWIPSLLKARVGKLRYDKTFDDFEVGRFKVIAGELGKSGHIGQMMKSFGMLLGEVALQTPILNLMHSKSVYDHNVSARATKHFFDKYISANPDLIDKLTMEKFLELRQSKLKEFAKEVSMLASFVLILGLMGAMLPDDDEDALTKFLADNSYKTMNRGLLELTFFFSPSSASDILANPAASVSTIKKIWAWFKAAGQFALPETEFTEEYLGVNDKSGKRFAKKTLGNIPVIGSWSDIWNIFDDPIR